MQSLAAYLLGALSASVLWLAILREIGLRQDAETARLRQELRVADQAREAMRQRLREAEQWAPTARRLPSDPDVIRAEIDALTSRATVFDDLEDESGSYGV